MRKSVSWLIYFIIYSILYLFPIMVLYFLSKALHINVSYYLLRIGALREIMGVLVLAYAIFFPFHRAKLATEAYDDRNMGFWQAHSVSGVVFKTHLSFLPIIGPIFSQKNNPQCPPLEPPS
ncbi:MAG: hypothetical protein HKP58_14670 [Desulfatitalea sp.]|nr:hypothetical protein [Desulfatitalea sp.]NNK01650.1 hypothetical protein [Desulfatitalea sp.]